MSKIVAFAWASGLIGFASECPDGALPIMTGDEATVRDAVDVLARHSRTNTDLFVPGVPEAQSQSEGMRALCRFTSETNKR